MTSLHTPSVPIQLPPGHPVVVRCDGNEHLLRCHCGVVLNPATGTLYKITGEDAAPECPRALAAADTTRSRSAMSPEQTVRLLRIARTANSLEWELERANPALLLGDHSLPHVPKDRREGFTTGSDGNALHFIRQNATLLTALMESFMANAPAMAALPPVFVGRAFGVELPDLPAGLGGPAAGVIAPLAAAHTVPFGVAIALALRAALTALGLTSFAMHSTLAASQWAGAAVHGLTTAPDGSMVPVNFYWNLLRQIQAADSAVRVPTLIRSYNPTVDGTLAVISDTKAIAAHGVGASIVDWAPRLGLLMLTRHDTLGRATLAAVWREWHEAIMAAATAARKDSKNVTPGAGGYMAKTCEYCGKTHGGVCRFKRPRDGDGPQGGGGAPGGPAPVV